MAKPACEGNRTLEGGRGKKVDSLPHGYLLLNCNDPEVMLRYDMIDQIGRFSWNEIPLENSPTKVRDNVTTSPIPSKLIRTDEYRSTKDSSKMTSRR